LDGHMVQGHVDALGVVEELVENDKGAILTLGFSLEIGKYLAFKGSITINGVSLTIMKLLGECFSVALIPLTLKETNLGLLKKGDKVNLETDMIARYLERLVEKKEGEAKYEFLKERNFL